MRWTEAMDRTSAGPAFENHNGTDGGILSGGSAGQSAGVLKCIEDIIPDGAATMAYRDAFTLQWFRIKLIGCMAAALLAVICLGGCSGREKTAEEDPQEGSYAAESIDTVNAESENIDAYAADTSFETGEAEAYEGTIKAPEASSDESPYYGIMHATVIDINGKTGDSSTIYTFTDKLDPDNSWSFLGLEIGDIETELTVGIEVAILFTGNIIGDTESVGFAVILPEGEYTLKRTEGKTVNNLMSQFTVLSDSGTEVTFIKDNCRMDDNALSSESGDTVIVYYADGGELGNYPVRVFKGNVS